MKCSNPTCDKHLGLVSYRVPGVFHMRFHSEECGEKFSADRWRRIEKEIGVEERVLHFLRFLKE